jgi:hypothetical protein
LAMVSPCVQREGSHEFPWNARGGGRIGIASGKYGRER